MLLLVWICRVLNVCYLVFIICYILIHDIFAIFNVYHLNVVLHLFQLLKMAGIWGLIASPLARIGGVFSTFSEESLNMLLWNSIGGAVLIAWNIVMSVLQFVTLDRLGILRCRAEDEIRGLDVAKHNEKAYGFGKGTTPPPTHSISAPQLWQQHSPRNSHNVLTISSLANNKVEAMSLNVST